MRKPGTIRLGNDNRITLPPDIRQALQIEAGDELLLRVEGGILLLSRPTRSGPPEASGARKTSEVSKTSEV